MRELQSQVCKCVKITEESNRCVGATVYKGLIHVCKQLLAFLAKPYVLRGWGHSDLCTHSIQNYAWLVVEPHKYL